MPVRVGIVAKSDIEPILKLYQAGHREGARAIHSDFAVMIHCHERKRGIHIWIHDRNLEAVALG